MSGHVATSRPWPRVGAMPLLDLVTLPLRLDAAAAFEA
jgi:hypothetical protein